MSIRDRSMKRQAWFRALPVLVGLACVSALVVQAEGSEQATLGIGAVTCAFDGTTESFNVARYYWKTPPSIKGTSANVYLVDHPGESLFAITGELDGQIDNVGDPRRLEHSLTLKFVFWHRGKKISESVTTCAGSTSLAGQGTPGDYRAVILKPCLDAQWNAVNRVLGADP